VHVQAFASEEGEGTSLRGASEPKRPWSFAELGSEEANERNNASEVPERRGKPLEGRWWAGGVRTEAKSEAGKSKA
jgi:hypothetical protein